MEQGREVCKSDNRVSGALAVRRARLYASCIKQVRTSLTAHLIRKLTLLSELKIFSQLGGRLIINIQRRTTGRTRGEGED